MSRRLRTRAVTTYWSEAELAVVDRLAEAAHLNRSDYLRRAVLGEDVEVIDGRAGRKIKRAEPVTE